MLQGMKFVEKGLSLAMSAGDTREQALILTHLAEMKWRIGDYGTGQTLSTEAQKLAKLSTNPYEEA